MSQRMIRGGPLSDWGRMSRTERAVIVAAGLILGGMFVVGTAVGAALDRLVGHRPITRR